MLAFLVLFFMNNFGFAQSQLAFIKMYDSHGRLIQYEPNSQYAHTALQIGSMWLESYPPHGVQLISWEELRERGVIDQVITLDRLVTYEEIAGYLGLGFDFDYDWQNETYYCSELLAKILGVPPEPMEFNKKVWPKHYWKLEGLPGISPDKLYRALAPL